MACRLSHFTTICSSHCIYVFYVYYLFSFFIKLYFVFFFFWFFIFLFFFFFSSRRRHTRCLSDWSSDVCSSDLWPTTSWKVPRSGRPAHDYSSQSRRRFAAIS